MWKYLNESVEGTSHRKSGCECQDASFVTPYRVDGDEILIVTCSDGAGSASHAAVGSRVACRSAADAATRFFEGGKNVGDINDDVMHDWFRSVHEALISEGLQREVSPRELACTLLVAVLGPTTAAFGQVGDGAIIIREGEEFRSVFWPQSGEYQNTTFFVTDPEFKVNLEVLTGTPAPNDCAVLTDGMQMLALDYARKAVHQPFFTPFFERMRRSASDVHDLIVPLKTFLDSQPVNDRTDDDKTLVLATRVTCADASI